MSSAALQPAGSGDAGAQQSPAVTEAYARFALELKFEDIPADVVEIAREQILATIGSCYAGSKMPGAARIAAGLRILGAGETATLLGAPGRMPAPSAALYNSAVAQIIEWDDWVIISHTGAAVVPTALAVGEMVGAPGREIVTAIVIGNEINGRTSRAIQRGAYVGNSMPNHQIETPLLASRLLGLDVIQARRAVSHSGFLAMESCPIGWMSDSKVLCNGLPAMWGIVAASLAKEGLVGNLDMIEHPAGLLSTVSEVVDQTELLKDLGREWYTRTLNTKRHPSCAYNLAAIECAIALRARIPDFDPFRVSKLEIEGPGVMLYVASRFQALEPDVYEQVRQEAITHVALCFDAGYGIMASLVDGELGYRQYLNDRIFSDEVRHLRSRIEFRADPVMHAAYYADYQYGARVRVTMDDSRQYVEERRQLLGARDRPFDHAIKFREGASGLLDPQKIEEAIGALRSLERCEDVRHVTRILET